jgi:hypothetical protein
MPMDVGFLPPTGNNGLTGQMPVGSITAFTNHLTGTPSLPSNWKMCDGSVIQDPNSPMNGQTLPDLNGGARFLRGSATSGTLQAADAVVPAHVHGLSAHTHSMLAHSHAGGSLVYSHKHPISTSGTAQASPAFTAVAATLRQDNGTVAGTTSPTDTSSDTWSGTSAGPSTPDTGGPSTNSTPTDGGSGSETRPINMSVIWIMRIW